LEVEWGQRRAVEFLSKLDTRIDTLKEQPFIGKPSGRKPEVRTVLITKHNRLYYKVSNNTIVILNMYDTRRNPQKNPFEI